LADFSWADKGKVKRVEEEANPFSFEVAELDFLEVVSEPSSSFEVRSWLSDKGLRLV